MSRITRFDKQNLKTMRSEINTALKAVFDKYGVSGQIENIRFDATSFRTKLNVSVGAGMTEADTDRANFEKYCVLFGLKKEDFGKVFTSAGVAYTVCGINPKSRKYGLVGKSVRGTRYKFDPDHVVGLINR